MKKYFILLVIILVFCFGCSNTTLREATESNSINYQDGLYAQGKLGFDLIFNTEINLKLDKNLIGFWYTKELDINYVFLVDGTYISILPLENSGAILSSGTWTTQGEDKLIIKLRSYDKQSKELTEIITHDYTYSINDDKLVLHLHAPDRDHYYELIRYKENNVYTKIP